MKQSILEAAINLAHQIGPLCLAGDDTDNALACARANAGLLHRSHDGRLCWHNEQTCHATEQFYWRNADGAHGWMCSNCCGVTQIG